jgi:hypothetical protein
MLSSQVLQQVGYDAAAGVPSISDSQRAAAAAAAHLCQVCVAPHLQSAHDVQAMAQPQLHRDAARVPLGTASQAASADMRKHTPED